MRLSAIAGVAIVSVGAAFYFGVSSLKGQLAASGSPKESSVSITTDGQFSPANVSVRPGDTLKLLNANKDPQVLKVKTGSRELFPVQVLFDTPFTFTVPANAQGTYIYASETLPDDRTLTIQVTPTVESAAASSIASSATNQAIAGSASSSVESSVPTSEIPLPFAEAPVAPVVTESSASSVSSSAASVDLQYSGDTAVISLPGGSSSSSSAPSLQTNNIPTNPYTVGTLGEYPLANKSIAETAKVTEQLHSGAPIKQLQKHVPKKVTSTGADSLLVFLPALLLLVVLFRRSLRFA